MKKEKQRKPIGKAKITIKNVKGFLQGNLRKLKEKILKLPLDDYIKEQIEWRAEQVAIKSPECLEKGECYCGCTMPNKMYEDRGCEGWEVGNKSGPCYPDMMNKEDWEKFKSIWTT